MLKIIFCFILSITSVFAYDFIACQKQASSSMEKIGKEYGVALKDNNGEIVLFYYSPKVTPRGYTILKHDPFVGMYLLKPKKKLKPLNIREINGDILEQEIASITPTQSVSGKISTLQQSQIDFATLNVPTFNSSIISTICDHIYGIGIGNNYFLEKRYIDRFLNNPIYYGDIGIRVFSNKEGLIEVNVVDPFFKDNPFAYGDIIMTINGESIPDLAAFNRVVFDLPQGSKVPVRINRNNNVINTFVVVDRRTGGMLLPENFLARIGIEISDNFVITRVESTAKNGFDKLKVGDKIIQINNKKVPTGYNNIIRMLGEMPDSEQKWLISRDDFQFFIEVNTKDSQNENAFTEYIR